MRLRRDETEKRMRSELPFFIRYCIDAYAKVGGNGTLIPDTTGRLESIIEENEQDVSVIFEQYFTEDLGALGMHARVDAQEFQRIWEKISYENPAFAKSNTRKTFNNYVKKRLGRKSLLINCKIRGKSQKMVTGLRVK